MSIAAIAVTSITVEPASGEHDVVVKVFLKPGVVEIPAGKTQYIHTVEP